MSFRLSPASLVDQRDYDFLSLLRPPSIAQPYLAYPQPNLTQTHSLSDSIPQVFIVNPSSDNVFRHISPESAHAAIVGLIYFSMWMGALGWDIVSTIPFDIRVLKETKWTSSFSAIYSIAYLLSRYVSLSWLITAVTNSVIMTDRCDAWMKGSTALFSVGISATMLVFCLRTCSIWHMQQRIVSLVVSAWFLVVAFAVLLPVMSKGTQLPTSNFCAWHFNGLYVVGVFGALLVFDLLCLVLTLCRLNKAGWKGIFRGIFPSSGHNFDSEDVKTMLVQKTTAFFLIQFAFLISALLVYVLTDTYAYRMMNIVASVAVASSMAGRIFRRAWRQTRELAPHNINRPPSYYPAWAEEHRGRRSSGDQDLPRPGTGESSSMYGTATPYKPHRRGTRNDRDSLAFYVEGEFGPKRQAASTMSLRSTVDRQNPPRTAAQAYASQQMRAMEAGHALPPSSEVQGDPVLIVREDGGLPVSIPTSTLRPVDGFPVHLVPAPAYTRREGSLSRPNTGDADRISVLQPSPTSRDHAGRMLRNVASDGNARRIGTGDSQATVYAGSLISFSSLTGGTNGEGGRDRIDLNSSRSASQTPWSRRPSASSSEIKSVDEEGDSSQLAMDEKRRRIYITSPPLTAGFKVNSKEESKKVYDIDSVKAAANLEDRSLASQRSFARPSTASSATSRPFASISSPLHANGTAIKDDINAITGIPSIALENGPNRDQQSTPRPKTAPAWPSPRLSPSNSVASQLTLMPLRAEALQADIAPLSSSPSQQGSVPGNADDNALLAFLHTVDQDSRDRSAPSSSRGSGSPDRGRTPSSGECSDDGRPRTARGNTASSVNGKEMEEVPDSDHDTVLGHAHRDVSEASETTSRPTTSKGRRKGKRTKTGNSSLRSASSSRVGTAEGDRPTTAAGGDVKPFGFGILPASGGGGSLQGEEESASEKDVELGSVIQRQFAKLAAQAEMSLDPPA